MISTLLKGIASALAFKLLDHYRHFSVQLLRIEAAKSYLHGVKRVRRAAIGLVRMGLSVALVAIGALLFHAGLFALLPVTLATKAALAVALGASYMVIGAAFLLFGLSERRWLRLSGSMEMVDELARRAR